MILFGVWVVVVINVFTVVMIDFGIDIFVDDMAVTELMCLELSEPSSCSVNMLTGDRCETLVDIDLCDMRLGELIEMLTRE